MKYYAGIGSRNTPTDVLGLMTEIAEYMAHNSYCLLSGGASGADSAFEKGATQVPNAKREIYLPWDGFNGRMIDNITVFSGVTQQSMQVAEYYHPNWGACGSTARKLMARNTFQILDEYLLPRAALVVCWTPDGANRETTRSTGGTGQAIRIAVGNGIRVYNLALPKVRAIVEECFSNLKGE